MNESQPFQFAQPIDGQQTRTRRISVLSTAERCAARLDGVLFHRGTHYEQCLPPLNADQRARALNPGPRFVIAGWSAAWVHGAARNWQASIWVYDRPTIPDTGRLSAEDQQLRRIQGRLRATDVCTVGSMRVTSPLKTTIDLIRLERVWTTRQQTACRLLLLNSPADVRLELRARLSATRRPDNHLFHRLDGLDRSTGS